MIDLEKAARLWKNGLSMAQIGNEMGLTRGQVSGRISRNREMFPPRIDPIKLLEAEIAGVLVESIKEDEEKAKARTSNALRKLFHEAQKPATPIPSKAESAEYDNSRLPYAQKMTDLDTRKCCTWPVTEYPRGTSNLFCAAVKSGKNYCSNHQTRAWRQT